MTNYPSIKATYVWDKQSAVGGAVYVPRNFFMGSGCTSSEEIITKSAFVTQIRYPTLPRIPHTQPQPEAIVNHSHVGTHTI